MRHPNREKRCLWREKCVKTTEEMKGQTATPRFRFGLQRFNAATMPCRALEFLPSTAREDLNTVNFVIGVTTCRSEFVRELFWSLALFMMEFVAEAAPTRDNFNDAEVLAGC
ncbi:hypothetical protein [uncultured Desulfuromonas sp.]|uniref:hypothetical protein n=1 Tax=uncultured Desulfuromonas sp. TaxID=181013 RepID=UPI002AAC0297|nr:hypothetical protein [uncultured Desulfuromonas sp.]